MDLRKKASVFLAVMLICAMATGPAAAMEEPRDLSVYYMNWSIYTDQRQEVKSLPWDRLSTINHAFWLIYPNEEKTEFPIGSCDDNADFNPGGCFDQYTEMKALYPDVTVMLSIGGWGAKWFPQMSATPETRKTFIDSCLAALDEYPFLGGIDLDWEYPLGSEKDQFTALLKEMREAMDAAGKADALLTICASTYVPNYIFGSYGVDFEVIHPYLDRINIMTYDMAGSWTRAAMHHASLYPGHGSVDQATASESAEYLLSCGVPSRKINIGSPLYSHGWVVPAENGMDALGQSALDDAWGSLAKGELYWHELRQLENTPGWEVGYDEATGGAYLYCNDPESGFYQMFYSYESDRSLQAKLDYINQMDLGGLIVWSTAGDRTDAGFPMLTQMAAGLGLYDGAVPVYAAPPYEGGPGVGALPPRPPILTPSPEPSPEETPSGTEEPPVDETDNEKTFPFRIVLVSGGALLLVCAGWFIIRRQRNS